MRTSRISASGIPVELPAWICRRTFPPLTPVTFPSRVSPVFMTTASWDEALTVAAATATRTRKSLREALGLAFIKLTN